MMCKGTSLPAARFFLLPVILVIFLLGTLLNSIPAYTETIRESVIAGTWYPGDPNVLRRHVSNFLKRVEPNRRRGRLVALIAPHAGLLVSGQVAAHAYKLLERHKFSSIIIIAPSHRARFAGVSVYDLGGYRTPLGTVSLDRELIDDIKGKDSKIRYVPAAHKKEHSLEIQLPFIQMLLPQARLVPLVMGEQRLDTCQRLAKTLADCIFEKKVLLVASTDLSHYHSYKEAKRLDARVIDRVKKLDPDGLYSDLTSGRCEACGGGPMITTMLAAKRLGAVSSEVLFAANSGDVIGDRLRVVGYMAAALWADTAGSRISPSEKRSTAEVF